MKPLTLKTELGPVVLMHTGGGRNYEVAGKVTIKDREVSFVLALRTDGEGVVSRESLTCSAKRVMGGITIMSTVGKTINNFIMEQIGSVVSAFLKTEGKRIFQGHVYRQMKEREQDYRDQAVKAVKHAEEMSAMAVAFNRTGKVPKDFYHY